MKRYSEEVSPTKKGERPEVIRIERMRRDAIAEVAMKDLSATDFAAWRDRRQKEVAPGTVLRELDMMSAILTKASKEWRIISGNPAKDVKRPAAPAHRERLPTKAEMEMLAISAGDDLSKVTARAYAAFLFAMETAMRAGEIVGLKWERPDLASRVAKLDKTKNGHARCPTAPCGLRRSCA
nr:tyrosine-type recombinase/integrase [Pseudogemmobacter bohemicus]